MSQRTTSRRTPAAPLTALTALAAAVFTATAALAQTPSNRTPSAYLTTRGPAVTLEVTANPDNAEVIISGTRVDIKLRRVGGANPPLVELDYEAVITFDIPSALEGTLFDNRLFEDVDGRTPSVSARYAITSDLGAPPTGPNSATVGNCGYSVTNPTITNNIISGSIESECTFDPAFRVSDGRNLPDRPDLSIVGSASFYGVGISITADYAQAQEWDAVETEAVDPGVEYIPVNFLDRRPLNPGMLVRPRARFFTPDGAAVRLGVGLDSSFTLWPETEAFLADYGINGSSARFSVDLVSGDLSVDKFKPVRTFVTDRITTEVAAVSTPPIAFARYDVSHRTGPDPQTIATLTDGGPLRVIRTSSATVSRSTVPTTLVDAPVSITATRTNSPAPLETRAPPATRAKSTRLASHRLGPLQLAPATGGTVVGVGTHSGVVYRFVPGQPPAQIAALGEGFDRWRDCGPAVAPDRSLVIADTRNDRVLRLALDGELSVISDQVPGPVTPVFEPSTGQLLVLSLTDNRAVSVAPDGTPTTVIQFGNFRPPFHLVAHLSNGFYASTGTFTHHDLTGAYLDEVKHGGDSRVPPFAIEGDRFIGAGRNASTSEADYLFMALESQGRLVPRETERIGRRFTNINSVAQAADGSLYISDEGDNTLYISSPLAAPAPVVEVDTTAVQFRDVTVGHHEEQPFTLTNWGTADLTVHDAASSHPAFRLLTPTPLTVAPGESTELSFTCAPDELGELDATLTLATNDPDRPQLELAATATARVPEIVTFPDEVTGFSRLNINATGIHTDLADVRVFLGATPVRIISIRSHEFEPRFIHIEIPNHLNGSHPLRVQVGPTVSEPWPVTVSGFHPPTAAAQWREQHFGDDAGDFTVASDAANPDHDFLPNAIERLTGADPNDHDNDAIRFAPPATPGAPATLVLTLDEAVTGLALVVQKFEDDGSWTDLATLSPDGAGTGYTPTTNPDTTVAASTEAGGVHTVTLHINPAAASSTVIRLAANLAP